MKKQQAVLRSAESPGQMDAVSHNYKRQAHRHKFFRHVHHSQPESTPTKSKQCGKCGKNPETFMDIHFSHFLSSAQQKMLSAENVKRGDILQLYADQLKSWNLLRRMMLLFI